MDVVHQRRQVWAGLNEQCLVAPLEHVAALAPQPVEARGERALQPLEPVHQIWHWRLQGQVVVVAHHDVSMQQPAATLARLEQSRLKGLATAPLREEVLAVVPPADDVIDRPRELDSALPRHGDTTDRAASRRQIICYTFDPFDPAEGAKEGDIFAIKTTEAFRILPYETAATYGGTSFKVVGPSEVQVIDQLYHYKYRPSDSLENVARNFATWWGKPSGKGVDYMIRYDNPRIKLE